MSRLRHPLLAALLCFAGTSASRAQTYAHDPFAGTSGTLLHGAAGGSGFSQPWAVAGFDGLAGQFQLLASPVLAYSGLHASGNHLRGGYNNTTASRRLDVSGSFPDQVAPGSNPALIGRDGTSLWVSVLLRKETTDDIQTAFSLANGDDLTDINAIRVGAGYYGPASNLGNQRFWCLLVNNPGTEGFSVLRTTHTLTPGQPALLVLRLLFGSSDTVELYVNPTPGDAPPSESSVSRTTAGGSGLGFRTVGFWSSNGTNNASLDEIRLGPTFASVTPTSAPPPAAGMLSVAAEAVTVEEHTGPAQVRVRRINGDSGAVSVRCTTHSGTAQSGRDFVPTTNTLSWADGDSSDKICPVLLFDDAGAETTESFSVQLSNATGGASLGIQTNATLTVLDNDSPASLPVENFSFELPAIPDDSFAVSAPPPGWAVHGNGINAQNRSVGVLNPPAGSLYFDPIPHGVNVGVTFLMDDPNNQTVFAGIEAGLQQTLAATLRPHTRHTLRVLVGNLAPQNGVPFAFSGFPGYRIDLMAGSTVLASDTNSLLPGEGRFLESTVEVTTGAAHPALGQPLTIRLVNLNAAPGIEVNFDHVRLDTTPQHPPLIVDDPASVVGDGGGALQLEAGVEGTIPLLYAWSKGPAWVPLATNAVFRLENLSRADSGQYRLVVSNSFGSATSTVATVRVREPTRVEVSPLADGTLHLEFRDEDGGGLESAHLAHFEVHASTNLGSNAWIPLPFSLVATNGSLRVFDPDAGFYPRRYYRVIER